MHKKLKVKQNSDTLTHGQWTCGDQCNALLLPLAVSICLVICAGCTSIPTKTPEGSPILMGQDEFAAYLERVFRHHNNVVDRSLFVTPSALDDKNDPVFIAEMRMHHACQPLNEVVSASATGQPVDLSFKLNLGEAVPDCEAATRSLEKLLDSEREK